MESARRALTGITYVRLEHNVGVAAARNVGLLASTADYVAFPDDGDVRLPGSLDVRVAALGASPGVALCCGTMPLADPDGELTGGVSEPNRPSGDLFWDLLELDVPMIPLGVVFRKRCFLQAGLFRGSSRTYLGAPAEPA